MSYKQMGGGNSINLFGDIKLNNIDVSLSGELQLLINRSRYNLLNFEAPIKTESAKIEKSGPNHSQTPEAAEWVKEHGFNIVSLANNHTMDYGKNGLEATINALNGVNIIGAGEGAKAFKPLRLELENGKKISIIAGTHTEFGAIDDVDEYGCASICSPQIVESIIQEKKESDFVIIYAHAGIEHMDAPLPEWRRLYRHFINIGCDAVVASHPHVPQGIEQYKGKYICYSLGNFCFQKDTDNTGQWWNYSLMCHLDFTEKVEIIISPLYYDTKARIIYFCDDVAFNEHLQYLDNLVNDSELYQNYIDKHLKGLLREYRNLFARSGYAKNLFSKGYIKGLLDFSKGRKMFSKAYILNNLQCESHRWAIIRALKQ